MICDKCGTQNPEGSSFCRKCGNALESPISYPISTIAKPQTNKVSFKLLIDRLPYVIAGGLALIFSIMSFIHGTHLVSMSYVFGNSMAEDYYYQSLGKEVLAFGWLGLAATAFLVGLIIKKK